MFGDKLFFIKTVFLLCCLSVSVSESSRSKKDVHHMIILDGKKTSPRYTKYVRHNLAKTKSARRPSIIDEDNITSATSFEHDISQELISKKKKQRYRHLKTHQQKNKKYKKENQNKFNHLNSESLEFTSNQNMYSAPHGKWIPVDSQEIIYNMDNIQNTANSYISGRIIYPDQIDITTLRPVYFNMHDDNLYPSFNRNYYPYNINQNQQIYTTQQPAKNTYTTNQHLYQYTTKEKYETAKNIQPIRGHHQLSPSNIVTIKYDIINQEDKIKQSDKNELDINTTESPQLKNDYSNQNISKQLPFGARTRIKIKN
ncbi:uncharacterized protein LOC115879085 [Sitophilus oryzae]|uniref:Uncharacterized protein LOC115879085 n=1 Tax=Sitophilus oryzae TaxID=7048 RepID=A0A6J2XJC2_SITOR|nr:uncharacterized protein LOC115879085 [Sitophilus oryzae]